MSKRWILLALLITGGVSYWLGRVESPAPEKAELVPEKPQSRFYTAVPPAVPSPPPVHQPLPQEPVGIYQAPPSHRGRVTYDGYSATDTTVYRAPAEPNFRFRPLEDKDKQRIEEQQSPGFAPQPAHRRPAPPPVFDEEGLQRHQELQASSAGMGYRFRPKRRETKDRWTGNYQQAPGGELVAPVTPWPNQSPGPQQRYPWNPYGPSYREIPRWAASGF